MLNTNISEGLKGGAYLSLFPSQASSKLKLKCCGQ